MHILNILLLLLLSSSLSLLLLTQHLIILLTPPYFYIQLTNILINYLLFSRVLILSSLFFAIDLLLLSLILPFIKYLINLVKLIYFDDDDYP